MGNICCCIRDGGRRRKIPATETTPPLLHPPEIPGYYTYPPGTMSEPYDHHHYDRYPMLPTPYVAYDKAATIRNDINLRKETLRLEPDPENPGQLLVAFTFDAIVSGRITLVFFAKEGEEFQLTATKEDTLQPITFDFEKGGLGQKFIQPSGTGVDLSVFEDSVLFKEVDTDIFPLAIKMEAAPEVDSESTNMQITQMTFVKEKGEIKPSVMKQLLWVNGTRYELQDIYGIGNSVDASDPGKECVICLSEPRDTTVLPCRHMSNDTRTGSFLFSIRCLARSCGGEGPNYGQHRRLKPLQHIMILQSCSSLSITSSPLSEPSPSSIASRAFHVPSLISSRTFNRRSDPTVHVLETRFPLRRRAHSLSRKRIGVGIGWLEDGEKTDENEDESLFTEHVKDRTNRLIGFR